MRSCRLVPLTNPRIGHPYGIVQIAIYSIYSTTNLDDIKKEIGYTVINIWNIKKQGTKKALHIFHVELKSKSNNKDIYEVGSFLECRVKFKPSYPKRETS